MTSDIDQAALRSGRMERLRGEMRRFAVDAVVLMDPVNVRYATGARNMQVFMARNPARYLFVPQTGPVILFEFEGCHHLAEAGLSISVFGKHRFFLSTVGDRSFCQLLPCRSFSLRSSYALCALR